MATIQASNFLCSSGSISSSHCRRSTTGAAINMPKLRRLVLSIPKLPRRNLEEEVVLRNGYAYPIEIITRTEEKLVESPKNDARSTGSSSNPMVIEKLHAIMEAVKDRIEMHKNIGEQRSNWNNLLLTSINAVTLAAAIMAAIAASTSVVGGPLAALKLSSTSMYLAATGMLIIMNKIQPSQLAEEQRNATRLFEQIHSQLRTLLSIGSPTADDVQETLERVLALDRAYPLPLIGVMLEKFPSAAEPAVWWPEQGRGKYKGNRARIGKNGWDSKLEDEMREIMGVMKRKDEADYLRLGEKALKLNKLLAISGPVLTGLAAFGSAFLGSHASWAAVLGIVGGTLAAVVNTIEHGWQVGMVFEMYRGNAGFFKLMEESINGTLLERDLERRENGELFEMKVALKLGRSLSELKDLAADSSTRNGDEQFASKLF